MIRHGVKIIVHGVWRSLQADNIVAHVEEIEWEVHFIVYLFLTANLGTD